MPEESPEVMAVHAKSGLVSFGLDPGVGRGWNGHEITVGGAVVNPGNTLAQIVARELGVNFRATSGPVITKAGDLAALLTNLEERDVLFIDEIHRFTPAVEEILYPAMEDYELDLVIGQGPAARSIRLSLPPFTLVGATTRAGLLTAPLRDRFGIVTFATGVRAWRDRLVRADEETVRAAIDHLEQQDRHSAHGIRRRQHRGLRHRRTIS